MGAAQSYSQSTRPLRTKKPPGKARTPGTTGGRIQTPSKEKDETPAHLWLHCNAGCIAASLRAVQGLDGPSILILHYYISSTASESPEEAVWTDPSNCTNFSC